MIRVKLVGHDYRYEAYQIINLFYAKKEIEFTSQADADIISIIDETSAIIVCEMNTESGTIRAEAPLRDSVKDNKNSIKMTLLKVLEEHTNRKIPYGILIGIRPTKRVHNMDKEGMSDEEIKKFLMDEFSVSKQKADFVVEVAHNEEPLLKRHERGICLYMHIPFCPTRCAYCSFTSNPIGKNKALSDKYIAALKKEIDYTLNEIRERKLYVESFYVGGGTPTSLGIDALRDLLEYISTRIDLKALKEFTIEAGRPDSLNKEKLKLLKDYGCTRISINPQTMNEKTLKLIGRNHTPQDVIDKFHMAREAGFDDINMDIIVGLPGEGKDEVVHTMEELKKLSPDSITLHTMAIKRASLLNEKDYQADASGILDAYEEAVTSIRSMGLRPYYMYRQKNMVLPLENTGYARPGCECIYNIKMIAESVSIVAMGADAISKAISTKEEKIERFANLKDVREYISRIDEIIENKRQLFDEIEKC